MGDGFLFPRLETALSEQLLQRLDRGIEPGVQHAEQVYAPLGGQPVPRSRLEQLRRAVVTAADLAEAPVSQSAVGPQLTRAARFDAHVGWALHAEAGLTRSEAAHEGVWAWLTLVLLPDVALRRFDVTSVERFRGGPRNVLRRVWWRVEVLGDLADPERPGALGEDEYVQVFERVSLGREPLLSRVLVEHLQGWDEGDNRSEYARGLTRTVLRDLVHTSPGVWDLEDTRRYVDRIAGTMRRSDDGRWRSA